MAEINIHNDLSKSRRKRSANWDNLEKSLLKSCITEFVSIIENKSTDTNSNKSKLAAWQTVTQRFNELNTRQRALSEIKQHWRTMKFDAKKNMSKFKMSMKCTGGGPKPPSPTPETMEILTLIPQKVETDSNVFDSDGLDAAKEKIESPVSNGIVIESDPISQVDEESAKENETPLSSKFICSNKCSEKLKRLLNDDNCRSKYEGTHFSKERNDILMQCIRQKYAIKMKNIVEVHSFTVEEHELKMKQMLEAHALLKEESQLRIEKLKLEILMLKSKSDLYK